MTRIYTRRLLTTTLQSGFHRNSSRLIVQEERNRQLFEMETKTLFMRPFPSLHEIKTNFYSDFLMFIVNVIAKSTFTFNYTDFFRNSINIWLKVFWNIHVSMMNSIRTININKAKGTIADNSCEHNLTNSPHH